MPMRKPVFGIIRRVVKAIVYGLGSVTGQYILLGYDIKSNPTYRVPS